MAYRGRKNSGQEKERITYVTVKGKLVIQDVVTKARILYTMRLFRDAVEKCFVLLKKNLPENEIVKKVTRLMNNAHYSYSALQRAKIYRNQPKLKLKKPQLYSVGKVCEKGNRNIRLLTTDVVQVKIPSASGRHKWVECKVVFGEKYTPIIQELLNGNYSYSADIVGKNGKLYLHVAVPIELYAKHDTTHQKITEKHRYIAGFDLNSDRINMVIINESGEALDIKNKHFPEVTQHGYPKNKAEDIILKSLSWLVDYAVYHSVKYFVFEKLNNIKHRKTRSRNANRKISRFSYRELLTHAEIMVKKRGGRFITINPAYASIDALPLSKRLGLDIHTASAYLLAIRYLNPRTPINTYEK